MIIVDSNVVIAALAERHVHNGPSSLFLAARPPSDILVAAHSCCEAYNHLTRRNGLFLVTPDMAQRQIASVVQAIRTVALSPIQTIDAMRRFADLGGVGPRLYDYLIGTTGEAFGADTIVTWNVRHFDGLFPRLRVATPETLAGPPTPAS